MYQELYRKVISIERKRLTAIKSDIKSITSGKYVMQEGFSPNYVLTQSGRKLSRVRVLGTIVDKFMSETGKFGSVTIDDGTDTIRAKVFNALSLLDNVEVGHIVDVFGKVREYQEEIFLIPEIISQKDIKWEILRSLELKKEMEKWGEKRKQILAVQKETSDLDELKKAMKERYGISEDDVESAVESQEISGDQAAPEENLGKSKDSIMKIIQELDKGTGAEYSEILEKSGLSEEAVDSAINELLGEGSCFEPKPGRIRKL
jgi:RPA family protein